MVPGVESGGKESGQTLKLSFFFPEQQQMLPECDICVPDSETNFTWRLGAIIWMQGESRLVGAEGEGFKIALRTLDHTRITIAAQALGIAQGALDYALGYIRERKQFGRAIADFQGIQFMVADMAMKLEAARQLTYAAAARSDRAMAGEKVPDLTFFSSACKCLASDAAMSVTTDAVQLLGGYGYVNDFPAERMMRDAKITQIYEGTNQIQRMVMARQLLKG